LDERTTGAKETDPAGIQRGMETDGAGTQGGNAQAASFNMRKRINSTTYEVVVHFSPASRETLDEKILRLARGEALNEGAGGSEKSEKNK
jgi:hypothetical protein